MSEAVTETRPPSWSEIARTLGYFMASEHGEWSGVPMPVAGLKLEIESRNPWRDRILELQAGFEQDEGTPVDEDPEDAAYTFVNEWYSRSLRCRVVVMKDHGRPRACRMDHDISRRAEPILHGMRVSATWSVEAEMTAMARLETLLKPHIWASYVLTGAFLETSARSGLIYVFRRARPTLVLTTHKGGDAISVLCALCLHPVGYFQTTFSGSMVPTDEVIAHLLLMRGDEPLYWRRANQHSAHEPGSGL